TGPVILPAAARDPALLSRIELFRTLPLFEEGGALHDTKHLYGCNMAVRLHVFDSIGTFNEQLGPGASGLNEDGDLSERIRAAGMRVAYVPEMLMQHTADPSRLTWEFFTSLHRADARSRFVQRGNRGVTHAALHWLGALGTS